MLRVTQMRFTTFITIWILLSEFLASSFGQCMVGGGTLPEVPACVAFSADGTQLACTARYKIYVWSVVTGELQQTIDAPARIVSIAWVPGRPQIAAGSFDGTIYLWNPQTGEPAPPIAINEGVIHHLAFSADGSRLLVACEAWDPDVLTVGLWDVHRRRVMKTLAQEWQSLSGGIAFSPCQTTVAFGINPSVGQSEVRRWQIESGEWKRPCCLPEGMLKSIAYSPDGGQIVSGGWLSQDNGRAQGMISRWNTTDTTQVQGEVFPNLSSMKVILAPDGGSLVGSASLLTNQGRLAGFVARWPLGLQRTEWKLQVDSRHINGIAYSSDGKRLAVSSSGMQKEMSKLYLVDPQSGEVTASLWPPIESK